MFVAGTQLFTNSGWKNIEDISGNDKLLVRNFISEAEFIQPFALKKKQYTGDVYKIGASRWHFTVTPDHPVVYSVKGKFKHDSASNFQVKPHHKIHRKFKFMLPDEPKRESITVWDEFGRRTVTIPPLDWYKLVGFVLIRGFIKQHSGRPMLHLFLDKEKLQEEIAMLSDIFDRLGLYYHVQYSEKTSPKLVVSSKNTLSARLMTRLGSSKRKTMYLPDKIIYNSSRELTNVLIETIIQTSHKKDTERKSVFQMTTTNKALIDSLMLLGTLGGYGIRSVLLNKAGVKVRGGFTKNPSYILQISSPTALYSPKYSKKLEYSGYVYGIDLFYGQVYAREGKMPVWIDPK